MRNFLYNYFKLDSFGSTIKKELIGGVTTFLAMIYILTIEPQMLSQTHSIVDVNQYMMSGGLFLSTVIVAFLGTIIMGLSSNVPGAIAPGMGLNAIFTINTASVIGFEGGLVAVMLSSILFTIFSVTKLRSIVVHSIPDGLKLAIGAGIGFFVAYVGFKDIGFVGQSDGIPFASLGNFKRDWSIIIFGIFLLALLYFFHFKKVIGGVAIVMVIGLVISLIIGNTVHSSYYEQNFSHWTGGWSYKELGDISFNLKACYQQIGNPKIWSSPILYISAFMFLLIAFFDGTSMLTTITHQISGATGKPYPVSRKVLRGDALGSFVAGFLGTSSAMGYMEATSGVHQGSRTGLSAIFTGLMFIVPLVLFPAFQVMRPVISGAILIYVGSLMVMQMKDISWKTVELAIPCFLAILVMVITYTISNGVGVGMIFYTIIALINKQYKSISVTIYILDVIFIAYFISWAFI